MSSLTGSPNALPPHPAQSGLLASHATGGTGVNCSHAYQVTGGLDQNRLVQAYEHALSQLDALRLVWSGPAAAHWQLAEAPRAVVRVCDLRDENLMADGRPGTSFWPAYSAVPTHPWTWSPGHSASLRSGGRAPTTG